MMEDIPEKIDSNKFERKDMKRMHPEVLNQAKHHDQLDVEDAATENRHSDSDESYETDEEILSSESESESWSTVDEDTLLDDSTDDVEELESLFAAQNINGNELPNVQAHHGNAGTGNRDDQMQDQQQTQTPDICSQIIQRLNYGPNHCIPGYDELDVAIRAWNNENNLLLSDSRIRAIALDILKKLIGISISKRRTLWSNLCEKYEKMEKQQARHASYGYDESALKYIAHLYDAEENLESVPKSDSSIIGDDLPASKIIKVRLWGSNCGASSSDSSEHEGLALDKGRESAVNTSQCENPIVTNGLLTQEPPQVCPDQDPCSSKTLSNSTNEDKGPEPGCSKTLSNNHCKCEEKEEAQDLGHSKNSPSEDPIVTDGSLTQEPTQVQAAKDPCCSKTLSTNNINEDKSPEPHCSKTSSNNLFEWEEEEEAQLYEDGSQDMSYSTTLSDENPVVTDGLLTQEAPQVSPAQDSCCSKTWSNNINEDRSPEPCCSKTSSNSDNNHSKCETLGEEGEAQLSKDIEDGSEDTRYSRISSSDSSKYDEDGSTMSFESESSGQKPSEVDCSKSTDEAQAKEGQPLDLCIRVPDESEPVNLCTRRSI